MPTFSPGSTARRHGRLLSSLAVVCVLVSPVVGGFAPADPVASDSTCEPGRLELAQAEPTPVRQYRDGSWDVKVYRKAPRRPNERLQAGRAGAAGEAVDPGLEPEVPTPTLPPTPAPPDPSTVFVAVVDARRLSRAELDRRAAEPMKKAEALMNVSVGTVEYNEVRNRHEGILVQDWVDRMLLAEEARRRGIMLSQTEFDRRFREATTSAEGKEVYENTMKTLGMTPGEVRSEFFDTLLGEKVVDQEAEKYADDGYLRSRYNLAPQMFYRPAQVHVLHYSQALAGSEDVKEMRALRDRLNAIRKRMDKGESPAAIAEEEGGKLMGVAGLDLGWIEPGILTLPLEVQEAVAKLKVGETSPVVISKDDKGRAQAMHLARVIESRPAAGETFESARPMMIESLKEGVRAKVIEQLKAEGKHQILVNLSGLPQSSLESNPQLRAWSVVRDLPPGAAGGKASTGQPGGPSTAP